MGTNTDYFEARAYKPKYYLGDRVFGYYQKIPFVGTVGNDRLISLEKGPEITIHLDLPLVTKNSVRTIIVVKHRDIRPLTVYTDEVKKSKKK